jgi:uncharacterized short protein YbdD (DUF466 family)
VAAGVEPFEIYLEQMRQRHHADLYARFIPWCLLDRRHYTAVNAEGTLLGGTC